MLKVYFNGRIADHRQPLVSGNNRGLLYGDGLFETILVMGGRPLLLNEHLHRLKKGMDLLSLTLPEPNRETNIGKQIEELIKTNNISSGRFRVTVFRGDGRLDDIANGEANLLIQGWPLKDIPTLNNKGLKLTIYTQAKKSVDAFSHIKHNNFLPFAMGMHYARENEADDALILNPAGRVCETCIANIWMVKDGILRTPSLDEGPIAGIMRNFLIRHCTTKKIPIMETAITLEELKSADEIFISNSIRIINWVENMDGVKFSHAFSTTLFETLKKDYPEIFPPG